MMSKRLMINMTRLYSNAAVAPKIKPSEPATTFKSSDIELELQRSKVDLPDDVTKLTFGAKFTDHMFSVEWSADEGWSKPKIAPMRNIELHPAAKVLHYAVEVFEGMKAYYGVDGRVRLFRPDLNAKRILKSSLRSTLPPFDENEFIQCLKKYVNIESGWIPKSTTGSLYLRPTVIGTDPILGVNKPSKALFYIIASPTGPYFPTGFKPVTLMADPRYVRAFPGGVGGYKCGSNYGPTLYVQNEAAKKGCQQVLWLYDKDEYLTEAGTMNIFLVIQNNKGEAELITPPLDGTILEGVTRQSIIDLAKSSGKIRVCERPITMKETLDLMKNNRLLEAFGAGTAAVACPIEAFVYQDKKYNIPTMQNGAPYMNFFLSQLNKIHYGMIKHEWGTLVDEQN